MRGRRYANRLQRWHRRHDEVPCPFDGEVTRLPTWTSYAGYDGEGLAYDWCNIPHMQGRAANSRIISQQRRGWAEALKGMWKKGHATPHHAMPCYTMPGRGYFISSQ